MRTILLVICFAVDWCASTWPYSTGWGYYPSGGLRSVLLILVILALTGRLKERSRFTNCCARRTSPCEKKVSPRLTPILRYDLRFACGIEKHCKARRRGR